MILDQGYRLNVTDGVVESASVSFPQTFSCDLYWANFASKLLLDLAQLLDEINTDQRLGELSARFLMRFTVCVRVVLSSWPDDRTLRAECLAPLVPLFHRFRHTPFLPGYRVALAHLFEEDLQLIGLGSRTCFPSTFAHHLTSSYSASLGRAVREACA